MTLPSEFDEKHFPLSRDFINKNRAIFIEKYLKKNDLICDIGSQGKDIPELHDYKLITLDISDATNPDIVADITTYNDNISNGYFDALMCTEVLEHVVEPFATIRELRRITKVGGYILFTTPLNARIHGPVPDCWRFTEFGLKVLFRDFEVLEINKLNTPNRNLFPLHYCAIVKKISDDEIESDPRKLIFQKID